MRGFARGRRNRLSVTWRDDVQTEGSSTDAPAIAECDTGEEPEHRGAARERRFGGVGAEAELFYVPEERKIALDELGTYVWDLCDGQTPVKKIISLFASKHKLGKKEAEVSVVEYMKQLTKKGVLGLMVEKPGGGGAKKRGAKGRKR